MTKEEAKQIMKNLMGWNNPKIHSNEFGDFWITAVDPIDNRRKEYNPETSFFE